MVRFLPKEEKFFDYFDQMSVRIQGAIVHLEEMMRDLSNAEEKAKQIKDLEHEADHVTHETVSALHRTFVTPIDRDAIYSLITRMDDILDLIDSVSQRTLLYRIKSSTPEAVALVGVLRKTIEQVVNGVHGLRNLKEPGSILNICIEINRLENEGDRTFRSALSSLFSSDFDPVEIIKWKDIYETIEDAIDRCEDVANTLEGIVVEHA